MMTDSPDKWMCDIEGCLEPADYVTKHADHRKCREHFFWGLLAEEIELEKLRETNPEFCRLHEAWHFFVEETMKPPSIFDVSEVPSQANNPSARAFPTTRSLA